MPGCAIASSIELGIYAQVDKISTLYFELEFKKEKFKIRMEKVLLEQEAKSGSFFSYVCGIALYMLEKYNVKGIRVNIKKMTLPIEKGLSSSAAICILIAKSFNQLYSLNMNKEEIKEAAYQGEHIALSNCGKLDQTAILEEGICKIDFLSDKTKITHIKAKEKIRLLLVDLNGSKNTGKIMKELNACFPFYKNRQEKRVHKMMGTLNQRLVNNSVRCIEKGNLKRLGKNMNKMQVLIDDCQSVCNELKAPKLHQIMKDKKIKKLSYGIKGVGSGGDGCAQILAKNKTTQMQLQEYIETNLQLKTYLINL